MVVEEQKIRAFQNKIWAYYRDNKRDLPWRHRPSQYDVFISEVMLQQTQVSRVEKKFVEWLAIFPSFELLARAPVADVIVAWQGLGYNRRALWLHQSARQIITTYSGILPSDSALLRKLPGIGENTAGSIAAFAFNLPVVFIETNIRRVFIHEFFDQTDSDGNLQTHIINDRQIIPLIQAALMNNTNPREWYYALMDYGSVLPKTVVNPNRRSASYAIQTKFEGSVRQLRGEVLRKLALGELAVDDLSIADPRLNKVLSTLIKEGFIQEHDSVYRLAK